MKGCFSEPYLLDNLSDWTGFIPPYSIEAEQSVLGALFLEESAVQRVSALLKPGDFYREAHQVLFEACLAVSLRGETLDLITIQEELRQRGQIDLVGGMGYLTALTEAVPTSSGLEHWARVVQGKARDREAIFGSFSLASLAKSFPGTDIILAQAQQLVRSLLESRKEETSGIGEILREIYEEAEEMQINGGGQIGIATGYRDLDRLLGNMQRGDLLILAARPSMGKTSLALMIGMNVALGCHGESLPVLVISLEMSKRKLGLRLACADSQIDSHKVRRGDLNEGDWSRLQETLSRLYEYPLFITDKVVPDIDNVVSIVKARHERSPLGLVVIDYLQLMRGHGDNRNNEIDGICRDLKRLAVELDVPVLVLSQLSRKVEDRQNKRPILSDLRDSGGIEANADVVMMLYWHEYYTRVHERDKTFEPKAMSKVEVIVEKSRDGATGTVTLGFFPAYTRFVPLENRDLGG